MSILFRVDSGFLIGSGHLFRCIALADIFSEAGVSCIFLCRDLPGNMSDMVITAGYKFIEIPSYHSQQRFKTAGLEHDLDYMRADAKCCLNEIKAAGLISSVGWVITDHPAIGYEWQSEVKKALDCKILTIDGTASSKHNADILIDPQIPIDLDSKWAHLLPQTVRYSRGQNTCPSKRIPSVKQEAVEAVFLVSKKY